MTMRLTRFTDLGLQVLVYLAHANATHTRPTTIADIAVLQGVPHNHLVKVVSRLSKLGWVTAARGRSGGLRLGVRPRRLRLGEIVRQLERCDELVNCGEGNCALHGHCLLKHALDIGLDAFIEALDQHSLSDIAGIPHENATTSLGDSSDHGGDGIEAQVMKPKSKGTNQT